jgi:hypothetical protein
VTIKSLREGEDWKNVGIKEWSSGGWGERHHLFIYFVLCFRLLTECLCVWFFHLFEMVWDFKLKSGVKNEDGVLWGADGRPREEAWGEVGNKEEITNKKG